MRRSVSLPPVDSLYAAPPEATRALLLALRRLHRRAGGGKTLRRALRLGWS